MYFRLTFVVCESVLSSWLWFFFRARDIEEDPQNEDITQATSLSRVVDFGSVYYPGEWRQGC